MTTPKADLMANSGDPNEFDVVIVGAGMAGLSAAIEAADGGARVVVLDARSTIGGRARTRERDGYAMNEGGHALYVDGAAMTFLRELGREPRGGVPDAGAGIGVDGDREGAFPTGLVSLLRTPLLKGDRVAMARLFAKLPRLDPASYAHTTVDVAVRDLLGGGRAARLAHGLFRLSSYFNDPARTSADAGLVQLQMVVRNGVRYLDNGWQTMVDSLEKICIDRGVEIRTATKATAVRPTGEGYLVTAGDELSCRRVVVAGSPQLAAGLLGDVASVTRQWAADARPATVAALDVGFPRDWQGRRPFALGIDQPTYLSMHAPVADLAPEGHTLLHVMRYHPNDETPDADADRAACEALLERVSPRWRSEADHVSFSPRLVASTDQPSAACGGLGGRPPVTVPGHSGLFVAGDWVGPEGVLVDASVASGRAAGQAASR
ncbi:MAG: FAD-dependent oxidoreductase [Acidimicrobiales bacterium]|nr:FAD-dependent oxidoreductase [Acidimicrobiales bacterium]